MMKAPFAFALAAHHRARASYVAVLIYGSRKTRTFRQHCPNMPAAKTRPGRMCLIVDMGQFRVYACRTNADGLCQFPRSMAPSSTSTNSSLADCS